MVYAVIQNEEAFLYLNPLIGDGLQDLVRRFVNVCVGQQNGNATPTCCTFPDVISCAKVTLWSMCTLTQREGSLGDVTGTLDCSLSSFAIDRFLPRDAIRQVMAPERPPS